MVVEDLMILPEKFRELLCGVVKLINRARGYLTLPSSMHMTMSSRFPLSADLESTSA